MQMKSVFRIIGVLTGILLIILFLQYSNYAVFPMHIGPVLNCSMNEGITSSELVAISQNNNITTFTIAYDNTSFFNRKINFIFLNVNPKDHICFGRQNNPLPSTQVYYTAQGSEVTYIQRFWVVENEDADFNSFASELEDNFPEYEYFTPAKLSILDILNVQNLYFFTSVFLLLFFCNLVCLHKGCKKVTMSALDNCKVFNEINPYLIKNIWKIITPYLLISGIFGVYVFLRNSSFLSDFFKAFIALGLILLVIQIICVRLAFIIVRKVVISSWHGKTKRNFSIVLFLILEIIAICQFTISSRNIYFSIMNITLFEQGANVIDDFSPAYITTSKIPDDSSMEKLLSVFDEVDMNNVYNYAHPTDSLLGYKELRSKEARDQMYTNTPTVRMSYNMLDFVPIYDTNGVRLRKEDLNQQVTTLLIPNHLKENTENILHNFYDGQSFEVRFIQSNQEHFDILDPSRRVLNAKYMLTPLENNIYYTNGEVLFDDNAVTVIEQKIANSGFDQGTISLTKLSANYEETKDEMKVAFVCDGLLWVINGVYFLTMVISGGVAFFRFRKKCVGTLQL